MGKDNVVHFKEFRRELLDLNVQKHMTSVHRSLDAQQAKLLSSVAVS